MVDLARRQPARVIITLSGSPPPTSVPTLPAPPCAVVTSHDPCSLDDPIMVTHQVVSGSLSLVPFHLTSLAHLPWCSLNVLCTHHYLAHITWLINPTGGCLSFPRWSESTFDTGLNLSILASGTFHSTSGSPSPQCLNKWNMQKTWRSLSHK